MAPGIIPSRAYDGAGNQITLTNRNGNVWQFQFDGANRLTNTITAVGPQLCHRRGIIKGCCPPSPTRRTRPPTFITMARAGLTNRTDDTGTTLYTFDGNDNRTSVSENGLTNSLDL